MRFRRAAWTTFCTCGALLLLFELIGPIRSSDPAFETFCYTAPIALLCGSIAGAYLLLSSLDQWASNT